MTPRYLSCLLLAVAALGCGSEPSRKPAAAPAEMTYPITGIVREVEVENGRVVLRHDEIPGYMPQMTMPFRVADKSALEEVNVGDQVKATLKVQGDRFDLVDLVVEEAAEAPPLVLSTSGGVATLTPAPSRLKPGEVVPDFTMTTQTGETMRLSDLRGKVVVLTFIFTRCPRPDFCPAVDTKFAEIARKFSTVSGRGDEVRLVSVSFDPEHDTPAVLADHARLRGAKPPLWQFAVATHAELSKVVRQLGLTYGPTENEIIHTLSTSIIDREGRVVEILDGSTWTPEDVFMTVRKLMSKPSGSDKP